MSDMNIMAGLGVAVREFQLTTGEADYGLYIDGKVAGVIEAKKRAPRLPELKPKPTSTPKAFLMESRTTDCRFPSPPDCGTAKSKSWPAAYRSNRFTSTVIFLTANTCLESTIREALPYPPEQIEQN